MSFERKLLDLNKMTGDNSITKGNISCVFKNLEDRLIKEIRKCDAVVGCVAWLTNPKILKELRNKPCSFIVQKEDFLRPDLGEENVNEWKKNLRMFYDKLQPLSWHISGDCIPVPKIYNTNREGFDDYALRCVGNHNATKLPAFPRMHNKFLVFLKDKRPRPTKKARYEYEYYDEDGDLVNQRIEQNEYVYDPVSVWTGSFNLTLNGTFSFENAVIIDDVDIAYQYLKEWYEILGLSEPLDWENPWISPEFRIGT